MCRNSHTHRKTPGTAWHEVRRGPEPAPFTVSAWRASWVERASRPLWLYRQTPGDRARRSVLFEASTVRRGSWRAGRASADLPPGDKRSLSEAPVSQPARPSVMSQPLKSHTRQARGSTAAALPRRTPISFAHSTDTQHPWMVVPRALRANYDRQPGRIRFLICAARRWCPRKADRLECETWNPIISGPAARPARGRCDRVWLVPLRALRHPPATPPGSWRPRRRTFEPCSAGSHYSRRQRAHIGWWPTPRCSFKIPMIGSSETHVAP
jgi:hypothetical protein